ncbi:STAS/SEC14 domain-containing protein [Arthrobacter sp. ISL-30]|nr:STAS/SEC14 domain-containing protein [Arthrobacter sp. ISL-30]
MEGGKGNIELRNDGIVHIAWRPKGAIGFSEAHAAMAAVAELSRGVNHPLLVDLAMTETVSRDARAVFSRPWAVSRVALLGSGPVDRVISTLFLGGRPACPARFFTSRNEAMDWLARNTAV